MNDQDLFGLSCKKNGRSLLRSRRRAGLETARNQRKRIKAYKRSMKTA